MAGVPISSNMKAIKHYEIAVDKPKTANSNSNALVCDAYRKKPIITQAKP